MKNKKNLIIFGVVFMLIFSFIFTFVIKQNKKISENTNSGTIFSGSISKEEKIENVITLIEDKRNLETDLTLFLNNLKKQVPSVSEFKVKKLDFSDVSVKEYMQKNNINFLPAIIFSTNNFSDETGIKKYLTKMDSSEYFLNIGASYNPFSASQRGFSIVDKEVLESLKSDSYFENGNDKKIIWLEYGNLSCSYCQNFNNSGIIEEVLKNFNGEISKTYNSLRINDGNHSEILECFAQEKGEKGFFDFLKLSFKNKIFNSEDLILEADKQGVSKEKIELCLLENKFSEKINIQTERALGIFGIKSTPTSVFINNETGEYKIVYGFDEKLGKEPYLKAINDIK